MLTRRHIRVKVLQSVYAFRKNETTNIEAQEKFFLHSLGQIQDLYLLMLQLLVSIRAYAEVHLEKSSKKHLASQAEKNPSHVFVNNKLLKLLAGSQSLKKHIKNKKLDYWKLDGEYVGIIFKELRERQFYQNYLQQKETSFKEDRAVVLRFYKEVIAPNDKLYDYIEDKRLTWLNDFPIVNTHIVKVLSKIKETNSGDTLVGKVFKNMEDRDFALQLFRKVTLHDEKLHAEVNGKTPNWDTGRIAELDMIMIKLGITEFLHFPSIPVRASINEYIEIAKEYSTPKSSIFVNGILDKLVKEYAASNKLNKMGRGLH